MTEAIDTSIWVAYFRGEEQVKQLIEREELVTSTIAIAELAALFEKQSLSFKKELLFMKSRAKIVSLTTEIALQAATIKTQQRKKNKKFGLADAMHYATALDQEARLVTMDNDFLGLQEVFVLGKK